MMRGVKVAVALVLVAGCSGCVTTGTPVGGEKGQAGKAGSESGGIYGGFASIGHSIGKALGGIFDEVERQFLGSAKQRAANAKTNERITWSARSSKTGKTTKGYVVPGEIYTKADGRQCRQLRQVTQKDGKTYEENSLVCKSGQGWEEATL